MARKIKKFTTKKSAETAACNWLRFGCTTVKIKKMGPRTWEVTATGCPVRRPM